MELHQWLIFIVTCLDLTLDLFSMNKSRKL